MLSRSVHSPSVVALLLLLGGSSGCKSTVSPPAGMTTRDSLGIQIVENRAPAELRAPWLLDTSSVLDIGSQSADPNQEFSGFVIPVLLSDGRIVVANGGTGELRFFGADGKWVKSVGRRGGGPGEFEDLGWLDVGAGDTLRTYDWGLRRLSVFSPDGVFLRPVALLTGGEVSSPRPLGMLGDGRLVAQSQNAVTLESKPGAGRNTVPLFALDLIRGVAESLGGFPGHEYMIHTGKGSVSAGSLPFGKDLHVLVHGSRVYVGTADAPEVLVLGTDGRVERVLRWTAASVPVTPADIEAYTEASSQEFGPGQEERRERFLIRLKQTPFPKWKPAYAGLLAGPDGSIWVRGYTEPDWSAPTDFEVFDSTGRWLGGVSMPSGYRPARILAGAVVGTWRDENDVQHVRVYRLSTRR
jgi:hypothetical protein